MFLILIYISNLISTILYLPAFLKTTWALAGIFIERSGQNGDLKPNNLHFDW